MVNSLFEVLASEQRTSKPRPQPQPQPSTLTHTIETSDYGFSFSGLEIYSSSEDS